MTELRALVENELGSLRFVAELQLPAAIRGNVRHFWDAGKLCTEVVSDAGTISNTFERLSDDALLGHAQLASQYFPCLCATPFGCAARSGSAQIWRPCCPAH
jgi:hypothetical protein